MSSPSPRRKSVFIRRRESKGHVNRIFQPLNDALVRVSRSVAQDALKLLRPWRGRSAARKTSAAPPLARSAAHDRLVCRTFNAYERALLEDERLSRFVPKPLNEAFDHPQSRPDADTANLVFDFLGRGGIALGFVTIAMAALFVALASGRYAPGGKTATSNEQIITPNPKQLK
jgi:hypothetical protein